MRFDRFASAPFRPTAKSTAISGTLDGKAISGEEFVGLQSMLYLPTENGESEGNFFTEADLQLKDLTALVDDPEGQAAAHEGPENQPGR